MNVYLYTSYHIEFLNAKNAYEYERMKRRKSTKNGLKMSFGAKWVEIMSKTKKMKLD